jgi:hypothetical protein
VHGQFLLKRRPVVPTERGLPRHVARVESSPTETVGVLRPSCMCQSLPPLGPSHSRPSHAGVRARIETDAQKATKSGLFDAPSPNIRTSLLSRFRFENLNLERFWRTTFCVIRPGPLSWATLSTQGLSLGQRGTITLGECRVVDWPIVTCRQARLAGGAPCVGPQRPSATRMTEIVSAQDSRWPKRAGSSG